MNISTWIRSICCTSYLCELYATSLKYNDATIAIPITKELFLRGDSDKIFEAIKTACQKGYIRCKDNFTQQIGTTLRNNENDRLLRWFGKGLLQYSENHQGNINCQEVIDRIATYSTPEETAIGDTINPPT